MFDLDIIPTPVEGDVRRWTGVFFASSSSLSTETRVVAGHTTIFFLLPLFGQRPRGPVVRRSRSGRDPLRTASIVDSDRR